MEDYKKALIEAWLEQLSDEELVDFYAGLMDWEPLLVKHPICYDKQE